MKCIFECPVSIQDDDFYNESENLALHSPYHAMAINEAIVNGFDDNLSYYVDTPGVKDVTIRARYDDARMRVVGVVIVESEPLENDDEVLDPIDNIAGQLADGWGEVFEQHPIEDPTYSEFYASFWSDHHDWRLVLVEKVE